MFKKLIALLLSAVVIASALPTSFAAGTQENLIAGVAYTTEIGNENYHSSHPDFDGVMLTDGLKGSDWGNAASVGFYTKDKTATFSLTFELDEPIAFKQITMGFFGGSSGIEFPAAIVIERKISSGNTWETIYSGGANSGSGRADTVIASSESIYAYALRISVTGGFVWTFMDEIEVFAETEGEAFSTMAGVQKVVAPQITKDLSDYKYINEGDSYTMEVAATSPENGTVSYQWYKDGVAVGENSPEYTIDSAVSANEGNYRVEITNTVGGYSASEFSQTCNLLVGSATSDAYPPVIETDIVSRKLVTAGDKVELEVSAKSVDGGTISYQWYKDGAKLDGETDAKLVLDPIKIDDEGVYEAEVINSKNGDTTSVFSNDCAITVRKEPTNLVAGLTTYTYDVVPYDDAPNGVVGGYHKSGQDTENKKLTDGVKATTWGGGDAVGVFTKNENATFDIDFTFDSAIEFRQINLGYLGNSSGINMPYNVKVYGKNNDNPNWTEMFNGQPKSTDTRYEHILGSEEAIEVTALRFTITGIGSWAFLDEIAVYDILSGDDLADTLTPLPAGSGSGAGSGGNQGGATSQDNNLAFGKTYEFSRAVSEQYPDTDGKELTDGINASSASFGDAAWLGVNGGMYQTAHVVIDLGSIQSFKEVRANILAAQGGVGVPNKLKVQISNDGNSWSDFVTEETSFSVVIDLEEEQDIQRVTAGFLNTTTNAGLGIFDYVCAIPTAKSARYVKLSWEFGASWVFIDEMQVNKEGSARPVYDPAPMNDRIDNPDPTNIAFGKSYEVNAGYASFYPDNGIKLTDGRSGTSSSDSKEWVAFNVAEGSGGYLSVNKTSAKYPTSIKVEYSKDGVNWKFFTDSELYEFQNAPLGTKKFDYGQPFASRGRYVRVTVTGTEYAALDEIQVFNTYDGTLDDELLSDSGLSYNLTAGYEATSSRNADVGDAATMLTDGIYGEWVKYDSKGNTSDDHIALDFDITDLNSVEKIILHTKSGSGEPKNVVMKVSSDGNKWTTIKNFFGRTESDEDGRGVSFIWDGETDGFTTYVEGATAVYTRFVRVEFDIPSGKTVSVDEVAIIGKRGQTLSSAIATDKLTGEYNLALGKPYTRSGHEYTPYPDTNGVELTDGIRGTATYYDAAWQGANEKNYGPTNESKYYERYKYYVVDLGEAKTITSVKTAFLGSIGAGFNAPKYCDVLVSNDNYNWMKLTNNDTASVWPNGIVEYGWHTNDTNGENKDMTGGADAVVARYVKVFYEIFHTNLIDEIEVYGYDEVMTGANIMSADEVNAKATPHDNGGDYMGPEDTNGIHDLLLCYNGWYGYNAEDDAYRGEWKAHRFKPMLTYIDEDGKSVDTLFDAVLFLALNHRNNVGHGYHTSWRMEDILNWLDQMFREGGDVDELNKAALQVREDLDMPDYKTGLVISFPQVFRNKTSKPFGTPPGVTYPEEWGEFDISTDNEHGDEFNDLFMEWWIDIVWEKFEEGNYEAIDFKGYYWTHEGISEVDSNDRDIQKAAELINAKEVEEDYTFYFYWIPYASAGGIFHGRKNNVDVWSVQTGHYFVHPITSTAYGGQGNPSRCTMVASTTSYLNASMEFEFDAGIINDYRKYNAFVDYMNAAHEYDMLGEDVYRSWYQGVDDVFAIAMSNKREVRDVYDGIYGIIKGHYEPLPHIKGYSGEGITGTPSNGGSTSLGGGGQYYDTPATPVVSDKTTVPEEAVTPSYEGYSWKEYDGVYKYEDADGKYVTGWAKINNVWYYFNYRGEMATGWIKLNNVWYYLDKDGAMQTGWLKDNGKWYYLYDWGGMANNQWVLDNNTWYYTRGNGELFTGWFHEGNTWYYLKSSGAMAKGWNWVGNSCYYFYEDGRMAANTTIDGYKVNASGAWVR